MPIPNVEMTPRVPAPKHARSLQEFLLYQRHAFAYDTALHRATGLKSFLDIACGLGPAMDLVTDRCEQVFAVDVSAATLDTIPDYPNLQKKQQDAADLSFEDNSISVAVAFQLIEHVDTDSAQQIVEHIRRVLVPGGVGFVTTPNARWRLLRGQRPWNAHHVREYWPQDIKSFCRDLGIGEECLFGVIGQHGAQQIEQHRVKQDPLIIRGGKPGRFVALCLNKIGRGKSMRRRAARPVTEADQTKQWFSLTPDYQCGLDFWIEIRK